MPPSAQWLSLHFLHCSFLWKQTTQSHGFNYSQPLILNQNDLSEYIACSILGCLLKQEFQRNHSPSQYHPFTTHGSQEGRGKLFKTTAPRNRRRTHFAQQRAVKVPKSQRGSLPSPKHTARRTISLHTAHFQLEELAVIGWTNHQVISLSTYPAGKGTKIRSVYLALIERESFCFLPS